MPPEAAAPPPGSPPGSPSAAPSPGPTRTHCENCGTKLEGPWCHRCGQHDFEFHRSFGHVIREALDGFFNFEGKFFRSIAALFFQPGRLTAEFLAGKRIAQMPPLRLYLFVSVLFFFLLLVGDRTAGTPVKFGPGSGASLTMDGQPLLQAGTDAPPAPPGGTTDGDLARTLERKAWQAANDPGVQQRMVQSFFTALPKMLLFCLPFFALCTRVLFRKSGHVYLQHLVLALHFHTFICLLVMFRDGWAFLAGLTGPGLRRWVVLACNLWLLLYPFLMLRRLFGEPWPWTVLKTFLLGAAYGLALLVAFFVTAIILFLLL